ncbi:DUF4345 domain-containing protein [Burkholderia thailandensis]|uniref:DUF4345 domain-containing protein n=1 Tax=Burkholderia thailandensis TaxID=57975 RepID=A0AAW9D0K2_BURTH|nr:DUF4345 domain-containing protein [Burkholderia thailandensis]AHI67525.1 hypothetical protein BTL_5088 [Burkholderia thailandensis H0587]AIP65997.1 membrane protein [Burkholderia thailandensis]AJY32215.1 hypothetical protein BTM_4502 [Burkholderia thailandensis 34]AOI55819.1 hypothetical protein WI24_29440 [Burkholderia thailandensis]AOJ54786.1 hypothetical protein AQ475_29235 [Burkholderia thailandensis]
MSKRILQIATAILAAVPVATGALGMMGIHDPLYASLGVALPADATLDGNLRFYAGVWFGLGLGAFWTIPNIERNGVLFRALWTMIFVGGIGRLISLVSLGAPFAPFIGFTVLEIVGAPLFVWWQSRVAATAG